MAEPKYIKWLDKNNLILLVGWARDGLSDEQIAHNMGISVRTFYQWKKKPECVQIFQAIKSGKEVVDYAVENKLLENAMNGNVTAQIFWLKNRKPMKWRDHPIDDNNSDILSKLDNITKVLRNASKSE